MSVTKTSLKYSYTDDLSVGRNKTFASINPSVAATAARTFGQAMVTNDIYPGGVAAITKIEKISTTTDEIPLS